MSLTNQNQEQEKTVVTEIEDVTDSKANHFGAEAEAEEIGEDEVEATIEETGEREATTVQETEATALVTASTQSGTRSLTTDVN